MKNKTKQSKFFLPLAQRLMVLFPNLDRAILQAEMDIDPVIFLSGAISQSILRSLSFSLPLVILGIFLWQKLVLIGVILFPTILIFGFFTSAKLPERVSKKRVRLLEKDLPYALRHLLIEVRSGIPLYQAMVSVSENYGETSKEFERIVREINAGTPEIEALEDAIFRNPSLQFRRSIWQIINALESGANISSTLESLVESIVDNQILEVRKYGKELNPYTLVYMLVAVILPSLGVTFLMILSTFTGLSTSDLLFYGILAFLVVFQYFFINFVRSKRPLIKV